MDTSKRSVSDSTLTSAPSHGVRRIPLHSASFSARCCPRRHRIIRRFSRTRRQIDLETHEAVFTWILQRLADAGLVKGKTIGIDATTLEANAARG
jgi:hypothetical protein